MAFDPLRALRGRNWEPAAADPMHQLRRREQRKLEFQQRRCAVDGCGRLTQATLCEQHRRMPARSAR
jgi:hypothetical protein